MIMENNIQERQSPSDGGGASEISPPRLSLLKQVRTVGGYPRVSNGRRYRYHRRYPVCTKYEDNGSIEVFSDHAISKQNGYCDKLPSPPCCHPSCYLPTGSVKRWQSIPARGMTPFYCLGGCAKCTKSYPSSRYHPRRYHPSRETSTR